MPVVDRRDAEEIDAALERALTATDLPGTLSALQRLFTEQLDFARVNGTVTLHGDGLPSEALRLAAREGVSIVAVQVDRRDGPRADDLRGTLKAVGETLGGDILLTTVTRERDRIDLVYPAPRDGRETLRRMVVRRGEPRRTVVEQLDGVYRAVESGKDVRSALEDAYNVEAVTKAFFRRYRDIFEQVMGLVEGLPDNEERKLFCQTLFNRLMFLEFLQRKGWLTYEDEKDYLKALWKGRPQAENFYDARLRILFFTALNNPRNSDLGLNGYAESVIGKVPFLNGGLFDKTPLDQREGVMVPDEAIRLILRDLFAAFNFTVAESTPYDVEVAVDPEMLGKVFEELVTGRHESGSYYTPRPIVAFMCREGLKGYLTEALAQGRTERERESAVVARFVDDHDVSGLTVGDARSVLAALEDVTVLDPACGSGAYLLGMLHELVELQRLLYSSNLLPDSKSLYDLKLRVIERNLYGADLDPFAVNVAMLRLWLSLAIEYEGMDAPPALPNLDFKIVQGDSLSAPAPSMALQPGLFRDKAHEDAAELARLKAGHLRAVGDEKRLLSEAVAEKQAELAGMLAADPAPAGSVDWRVQFADVFDRRGGFDIVVANPPYGATVADHVRDLYFGHRADGAQSKDTYGLFMARGLQLLRASGQFTYIVSDSWRTIRSHTPLRRRIIRETTINHVIDLPSWIFEATVNTCIITLTNHKPDNTYSWRAMDVRGLTESDFDGLITQIEGLARIPEDFEDNRSALYTCSMSDVNAISNVACFIASPSIARKVFQNCQGRLIELAEIRQGLATAWNEYYIRKKEGSVSDRSYALVDRSLVLDEEQLEQLTKDEKLHGISDRGPHFVPYDLLVPADTERGLLPGYYWPTDFYLDWSRSAVRLMETLTIVERKRRQGRADKIRPGDEKKIAAVMRSREYYFKKGIVFSRSGTYCPTFRIGSGSAFDSEASIIIPREQSVENVYAMIGMLSSNIARYIIKNFLNHTKHAQVDDLKEFPVPVVSPQEKRTLHLLVSSIIAKQKKQPTYPFHLYEQRQIDDLMSSLYGLGEQDVQEVRLWFHRRYPRLAEAQAVMVEMN